MTADPVQTVWDALERCDCDPHGAPWKGTAQCPAHDDHSPSLTIGVGADGRALVYCHAGCTAEQVVAALGLTMADLFPDGHRNAHPQRGIGPAQAPIDVILAAARAHGLNYLSTVGGELWVVEACPRCNRGELWIHEAGERGRVTLACLEGCEQPAVLATLSRLTVSPARTSPAGGLWGPSHGLGRRTRS